MAGLSSQFDHLPVSVFTALLHTASQCGTQPVEQATAVTSQTFAGDLPALLKQHAEVAEEKVSHLCLCLTPVCDQQITISITPCMSPTRAGTLLFCFCAST